MDDIVIKVTANEAGIADLNKQLDELRAKNKQLEEQVTSSHEKGKSQHKEKIDLNTKLTKSFEELGQGIVAAFAVEKLIDFGKEAVKAFAEAEEATNKLKFAVKNLAGGSDKDFKVLTEQAEKLSKQLNNLFSVKDIEKGQKALLQMNLTVAQTEKLLPRIADIAAKNGKSIEEMSEIVGKALSEGKTGSLTQFGAKFKELGNIADNTNSFLQETAGFIGGATDAMNDFANQEKEAQNRAEELQETVGKKLAPIFITLKTITLETIKSLIDLFDFSSEGAALDEFVHRIGLSSKEAAELVKLGFTNASGTREEVKKNAKEILDYASALESTEEAMKSNKVGQEDYTKQLKWATDEQKKLNETLQVGDDILSESDISAAKVKLDLITKYISDVTKDKKEAAEVQESIDKHLRVDEKNGQNLSIEQLKAYQIQIENSKKVFDVTGLENEKKAIQKLIDAKEKGFKDLEAQYKKCQEELDRIIKQDSEDATKFQIDMIKNDYEKKVAEETNNFNKTIATLQERQDKLKEIALKGNAEERKAATAEIQNLQNDTILATQSYEAKVDQITAEHDKKEKEELEKKEIEKAEIADKYAQLDLKKKLVDGKITQEQYDKQSKELEIKSLEDKLAIEQQYGNDDIKLQQTIADKKLDLQKEEAKKAKELTKQTVEAVNEIAQKALESVSNVAENNINIIDTQLTAQQRAIDVQKDLAQKGLDNDLAFEEKRADELTKAKLKEQVKLRKIKELETFLNALANFAEKDPKTALPKALALLAATKAAEAVYAEDGGIIGQIGSRSLIGSGMSRRHKSGNDVLLHAEKGEGILSVKEMNNLGIGNFNMLKSMLKTPFSEKLIPNKGGTIVVQNNSALLERLDSLEKTIKNKKEVSIDFDEMNQWIKTEVENGVKKVIKHVNPNARRKF